MDWLTALLEEKEQIIQNQNRARFGQSSEKRTYLLADGQLSMFVQAGNGIPDKTLGEVSRIEKQSVSVAAHHAYTVFSFDRYSAIRPDHARSSAACFIACTPIAFCLLCLMLSDRFAWIRFDSLRYYPTCWTHYIMTSCSLAGADY